jgi:hypothetical protein
MFFEIASSCISALLPVFLVVFEAILESIFWNGARLFCHGHLNGLNVSIAMVF